MRPILTVLSLLVAAPAFAGGVAEPDLPPVMIDPPEEAWTGFYYGAMVLYGHGTPTGADEINGVHGGAFIGYREDFGNLTIGVEADLTFGQIEASNQPTRELSSLLNAGVEIGYDAGNFLPYATFGGSYARFEEPTILPNFDASGIGYFYGIGVDYAVSDDVSFGAEVLQHRFEHFPLPDTDLNLSTFSLNVTYRY